MQVGKKNIIGIMGGIASGKTTIAKELAKRGCVVVDADELAKWLLRSEDVKKELVRKFGPGISDSTGRIDKKKLAKKVFVHSKNVKALNAIIHPRVLEKSEKLIKKYQRKAKVKAIVLDMPLLVEVGWHKKCDKLIFVACRSQKRFERAQKRCFLTKNELKKRENFQISLDKKAKLAHYTIENNDHSEMIKQIGELFPALISRN